MPPLTEWRAEIIDELLVERRVFEPCARTSNRENLQRDEIPPRAAHDHFASINFTTEKTESTSDTYLPDSWKGQKMRARAMKNVS
jgi:hypothetical protein